MNNNNNQIIRFDWAMKRLLRNKANFSVLEGLLTTLLGEKIVIQKLLESESNQEDEYDKYNRVDMLAENSKGELVLIEVQNNNEYAYFQRMLFGTSKLVTEYINRGQPSACPSTISENCMVPINTTIVSMLNPQDNS